MTVAITDLNATEGYVDGTFLTQAQLNAMVASIETFCNTSLARNVEQVAKDAWGTANYTLNSTGAASLANTLFDKQYSTDYYNGGSISIGTAADAGWANVDAVNAAISITPELAGKYRAIFHFNHRATSTATTEFAIETGFRITDGTDASYAINSGGKMAATAGGSGLFIHPVAITHVFNWTTTTAKTITLQKYNRTCTDVSANVVDAAAALGEVYMVIEKI